MHQTEHATYVADAVETFEVVRDDLLGKILHPNGTRDFPNGGAIGIRNQSGHDGRYRYRIGPDPAPWMDRHIPTNHIHNYPSPVDFYVKNTGTVDLNVTP